MLEFTFGHFTTEYCTPTAVTYIVEMDGSVLLPSWLSFDSITRTFKVTSNSEEYKGIKQIKVTGYIVGTNTGKYFITSRTFTLSILTLNTSPPIMKENIDSITIKAGELSSI